MIMACLAAIRLLVVCVSGKEDGTLCRVGHRGAERILIATILIIANVTGIILTITGTACVIVLTTTMITSML